MGIKRIFATRTLPQPVTLIYEVDGTRTSEDFTVRYKSFSPTIGRELRALEAGEDASLAKSLAAVVIALLDQEGQPITDESGEAATLDEGFFNSMNADNLKRLYDQIVADVTGPIPAGPSPSTASPSISPATASADLTGSPAN